MATDYPNDVQTLYVAYFGRPADPGGLAFWAGQLQADPGNHAAMSAAMSAAFASSPEYHALHAGTDNLTRVAQAYENLFGRPAEAAGLRFWSQALDNGTIHLDEMVTQIAAGSQGADRTVYNGKVAVSAAFTARIDTDAEQAAYSGSAANEIARAYVGEVRDLLSAASHMDPGPIDQTIARIVGLQTAAGFGDAMGV